MSANPSKRSSPLPSSLSDEDLVARINGGSEELLNELYNRYAGKIYYKCLGMVKRKDLAQDMAHDVFIKLSTNLHKYKGTAELSFWIYAITYNHCLAQLKLAGRLQFDAIDEKIDPMDESDQELTEKIVRDLKLTQLKKLIKLLRPEEELILLMRYQDGMSIKQIATILQVGDSMVKMRLKRLRNRLAKLFKEFEDE